MERLFTETVLPARSFADWMLEPAGTTTPPMSLPFSPVVDAPLATNFRSRPLSLATMTEIRFENAKSKLPLTTPGTIAAPPVAVWMSSWRPSSLKKPCLSPR
ncbi:hypothetical protein D9M72_535320 [compost metagenome]